MDNPKHISRKGREKLFSILFSKEFNNETDLSTLEIFDENFFNNKGKDLVNIIEGVVKNRDELDEIIKKYLINWKLERINKVELIILRVAIYELQNFPEFSPNIIINEAIELGKKYGDHKSYKFINGLLDKFYKSEILKNG